MKLAQRADYPFSSGSTIPMDYDPLATHEFSFDPPRPTNRPFSPLAPSSLLDPSSIFDDDDDDDSLPKSPQKKAKFKHEPSSTSASTNSIQAAKEAVQRLTSVSPRKGKQLHEYRRPEREGEWWSTSEEEWKKMTVDHKRKFSSIGIIMEVSGQQVEPCQRCKKHNYECWTHKNKENGLACAHCRMSKPTGGCSHVGADKEYEGQHSSQSSLVLRQDYDALKAMYEDLQFEHGALKEEHGALKEDHEALQDHVKVLEENMKRVLERLGM